MALLTAFALTGCGTATNSGGSGAKQKLSVLYAGSMTKVMEQSIRPNADQTLHIDFQGEGKGSNALAQMIKSKIAQPDVFISASPSVNTNTLMGQQNGNLEQWYLTLAQDQLVIAYSPKSQFAAQLKAAQAGKTPWYQVMESPGFHFGRTDPKLDPKGANTIFMFKLAEAYYHQPNLESKILGGIENPKQVFPEETLLAQLTSGQIDAVVAYKHEAVEWGMPYISLPKQINLGDATLAKTYQSAHYTDKSGKVHTGAPIVFTISIPATVSNDTGAAAFVRYMVSGQGHSILMKDGFTPIKTSVVGNRNALPKSLQKLVQGASG